MPQIGVNAKPKAKAGKHLMTLVGVKARIGPNKFATKEDGSPDPDALREQFVWDFESDEKNEFGEPLTYSVWTNTNYGNEKAGLTKFLNAIIPGLAKMTKTDSADYIRHMDTDNFIGTRYEVILRDQQGKNGSYIGHTDIAPVLNADGTVEKWLIEENSPEQDNTPPV